ncbi:hypothetical protein IWX46DRAFT_613584 [Phyllosticta citricarpa]|uniref:Uncharacterized protein n=1 Tax=Phyllosticta citricarpa TaxID=55181 RepID=A0ABR1LFW9_9PEZI
MMLAQGFFWLLCRCCVCVVTLLQLGWWTAYCMLNDVCCCGLAASAATYCGMYVICVCIPQIVKQSR